MDIQITADPVSWQRGTTPGRKQIELDIPLHFSFPSLDNVPTLSSVNVSRFLNRQGNQIQPVNCEVTIIGEKGPINSRPITFHIDKAGGNDLVLRFGIERTYWDRAWLLPESDTAGAPVIRKEVGLLIDFEFTRHKIRIPHSLVIEDPGATFDEDADNGQLPISGLHRHETPWRLLAGAFGLATVLFAVYFASRQASAHAAETLTIAMASAVFLLPVLKTAIGLQLTPLRYPELYLDPFWVGRLDRIGWWLFLAAVAVGAPFGLQAIRSPDAFANLGPLGEEIARLLANV